MDSDLKSTIWMTLFCVSFCIGIGVCIWVFKSHFEAKTYADLTGKQVTTWQAMWVELRVIEPPAGPALWRAALNADKQSLRTDVALMNRLELLESRVDGISQLIEIHHGSVVKGTAK